MDERSEELTEGRRRELDRGKCVHRRMEANQN